MLHSLERLKRALRAALLAVAGVTAVIAPAPAHAHGPTLPGPVRDALATAQVPPEALGAIAIPLAGLARTWAFRADAPMQPASTIKLLTSIVALEELGPNLRSRTELLATGPVEAGVLRGDLVLRGGADPDFGWPQLWAMLEELRAQGVREIAGDLVLDRTLFSPAREDIGVPPFDESPEWPYNAIPDALQLNGGLLGVALHADDHTLSARSVPRIEGIAFDTSGMSLVQGDCARWGAQWQRPAVRDEGTRVVVALRGGFPRGCTARAELTLVERTRLTGLAFRTWWAQLGGHWQGQVREGPTPAQARLVTQRESRPWGEVLRGLNKRSDNPLTRLLFLLLGVHASPAGKSGAGGPSEQTPTRERAAAVVQAWFVRHGIDPAGIVLDNGSGLSRSERIAPRQLAQALAVAHASAYASDLLMSVPLVGVDTALRLRGSAAAGRARLKPGGLRNVSSLAGIVPDPQGRPWAFVAMINHERAARAIPALHALVDWVARGQPAEPAHAQLPGPLGEGP
jgi:D-alanyl-D-alanine carboxypeptidase/D-alanyl-D-alanine-endopeptidase (penicillin-binding protein 4)